MASYLVVIYGMSEARRGVAWQLGQSLPGKSAVLSLSALLDGAIAQRSEDAVGELDMVHTQLRLLVANYMRNGYHVVVEGAFYHERDGETYRYEQDVDQLVALMRNMTRKALTVHLRDDAGPDSTVYRPRYGAGAMTVDAADGIDRVASAIREKLMAEEFT